MPQPGDTAAISSATALISPGNNPPPWANPANIAFNDKTENLLVANRASLTGLPDPSPLLAVFDVYVKDNAGKLFKEDDEKNDHDEWCLSRTALDAAKPPGQARPNRRFMLPSGGHGATISHELPVAVRENC